MTEIQKKLYEFKDDKYKEFQCSLIPTVSNEKMLGVRTPCLKKLAKTLYNDEEIDKFLNKLPHKYFDENQLHAFIISEEKDFDICIKQVEKFLPYIDNWATCDQLSPKCFKKHKYDLLKHIYKWIKSKKAYIVRFAIGMLMSYFLDDDYDKKYLSMVSNIKFKSKYKEVGIKFDPDKYYVEMMIAWYFATALAKQYKDAYVFIKNKKLSKWTHNKAIQKVVESYRVSETNKRKLKLLKI